MASIHLHHETPGCCPIARQTASASRPLDALDASLLELGMLSAVTDSRRDYLLEKRGADSGPHPSGLCVLAMNSAYIADLSRQYQPYDYPWRQRLVEMLRTKEAPCLGANKSNPGSPSKLAAGIVRSKSLDDLQWACGGTDIVETVSRKISNLHFG
ncbi:hypothetical protein MRX96_004274 [Rhipicephalus microplus]